MNHKECYRSWGAERVLFFLFILFLTAGCAPKTIPEPALSSPDQMRALLNRPPGKGVFKATARITVESPEGTYSKTVAMAVMNPSFLRIETLPLFGPPDLMFSVKETLFQVFLPGEGTYYIGAATEKNMHRFFGVALAPCCIIPILTGSPPLNATGSDDGTFRISRENGRYRADMPSENGSIESLWLNPASQMLEEIALRDTATGTFCSVTFDNFVQIRDRFFPGLIHVEMREPHRRAVTIRYRDMELSDDATENLFDLAIPPGITPILLEE